MIVDSIKAPSKAAVYLTIAESSRILRASPFVVMQAVSAGRIKATRAVGRLFVSISEIERVIVEGILQGNDAAAE